MARAHISQETVHYYVIEIVDNLAAAHKIIKTINNFYDKHYTDTDTHSVSSQSHLSLSPTLPNLPRLPPRDHCHQFPK